MYTNGVLASLKNGRLIAQSHIIPRFRVTKPHRGGLYQLEARASAREKGAMRDIAHTRESKHCTREEGRGGERIRAGGALGGRNAGACTPGRNEC